MSSLLIFAELLCLGISFLASGIEVALARIDRYRIRGLARAGNFKAQSLLKLLQRKEHFLWTLLIANGISLYTLLTISFYQLWVLCKGSFLVWTCSCAVLTLAIYLLVGVLPKIWFLTAPTHYSLLTVPAARIINRLFGIIAYPVALTMETLVGRTEGLYGFYERILNNRELALRWIHDSASFLPLEEQPLVRRVLDLDRVTVGAIALPLKSEFAVAIKEPITAVVDRIKRFGLKAVPVVDQAGRIVGLVEGRSVLFKCLDWHSETTSQWMKDPLMFKLDLCLSDALEELYKSGNEVALVVDMHDRAVGLLDIEHMLEFIFGDLEL